MSVFPLPKPYWRSSVLLPFGWPPCIHVHSSQYNLLKHLSLPYTLLLKNIPLPTTHHIKSTLRFSMPFIYWLHPNLSKPTFHYMPTPYERGHFMRRLPSTHANIISWNVFLLSSFNTSHSLKAQHSHFIWCIIQTTVYTNIQI